MHFRRKDVCNEKVVFWLEDTASCGSSFEMDDDLGNDSIPMHRPFPSLVQAPDKSARVNFDERRNEYFESEFHRTRGETERCWYSSSQLAEFRQDTGRAVAAWLDVRKQHSVLTRLRQPKELALLPAVMHRCRRSIKQAYRDSNQIGTEEDYECGGFDRKGLTASYKEGGDELVGLEAYLFRTIRGEPSQLVREILGIVQQRTSGNPQLRDLWMRLTSQHRSLPSRALALELAKAQAAALHNTHSSSPIQHPLSRFPKA